MGEALRSTQLIEICPVRLSPSQSNRMSRTGGCALVTTGFFPTCVSVFSRRVEASLPGPCPGGPTCFYTSPNAPNVRTLNGHIEIPLGDVASAGMLGQWNFNMAVQRSDVRGVRAGVLLIPELCPGGQRQGLTLNKSTLLVENDSKKASKPIESPRSEPGPNIRQNSLFVAA